MILLVIVGIFYYFWNDLQKREAAEAARLKQRKEDQAKRDAEYERVRKEVRSLPKARTRSLPRTTQPPVATPRQAAPSPTRRVVERSTTSPTVQPAAPAASQDTLGDVLVGAAVGYAIASLIADNSDDRPSQSCSTSTDSTPFSSGGGGDYGGGGASSSWDSSSSSSSSDSSSYSSSSDSSSSSSWD